MKTYHVTVAPYICFIVLASCCCIENTYGYDDERRYAKQRIMLDGEREWTESKKKPGTYYLPFSTGGYNAEKTMKECVRSYVEDGNLSGIRGAFLMAYVAASCPHRSGDVMLLYAHPLMQMRDQLGDKQFALCLSKMRPEVQSAVFYFLFFLDWPKSDKEWDKLRPYFTSKSCTYILSKSVPRLKWPHDYE